MPAPSAATGTAEDVMSLVSRAEEKRLRREGVALPEKSPLLRRFIELPLNLVGKLVAFLIELVPAAWTLKLHERVFLSLAAPGRYSYRPSAPAVEQAREFLRRIGRETGRAPALLALLSHPPTQGELNHLNFELARHAMLALRDIRQASCRPRLVIAIDPFALDVVPLATEALYAGTMGTYHLGLDRMSGRRSPASRGVIAATAWPRMPYRLLRLLAGGKELSMVLAGGVPFTTRILYASKEWLADQIKDSPLRSRPRAALESLRRNGSFVRFQGGWLSPSAWRLMEAWLAEALAGLSGEDAPGAAYTGKLAGPALDAAQACLSALGFDGAQARTRLDVLADDLARETPYRARFFNLLAERVLARGRPLILLPIAHRIQEGFGIEIKAPWAWVSGAEGRIQALKPGLETWQGSAREFSRLFVRENFA